MSLRKSLGVIAYLEDIVLPFASDSRFDDDTVFLVFEEDFRFAPEQHDKSWRMHGRRNIKAAALAHMFDNVPTSYVTEDVQAELYAAMAPEQQRIFDSWSQSKQQALLRDLIEKNPLKVNAVLQSSDASCSAAAIPHGESPVPHHQLPRGSQVVAKTPQYVVASKAGPDAWEEPSIFLRDLIAYCNVAARRKKEIVWLGWQPGNAGVEVKHVDRFCSGAMCIAITKLGAEKVYADMRAGHRELKTAYHWDIVLKKYLSSTQNNWHCYITPPIGGYTAHVTGCAPEEFSSTGGVRPSIWHSKWACTGTREDHDWQEKPRAKWLCSFTKNGMCNYLEPISVQAPDESVVWRSWRQSFEGDESGSAASSSGAVGSGSATIEPVLTQRKKRIRRAEVAKDKYRSWASSEQEVATIGPQWMSDESGPYSTHVSRYMLVSVHACLISYDKERFSFVEQ